MDRVRKADAKKRKAKGREQSKKNVSGGMRALEGGIEGGVTGFQVGGPVGAAAGVPIGALLGYLGGAPAVSGGQRVAKGVKARQDAAKAEAAKLAGKQVGKKAGEEATKKGAAKLLKEGVKKIV